MKQKKEKLYTLVYNDLIAKIMSGDLKVGDKLPTEIELTEIYGVSRITVAHALKDLAAANLIYRVKKSGTFVNGKLNRNVPLIIPTILPFEEEFNGIMSGIQNTALEYNTFTPFYNSKNNLERERAILTDILASNPNGLIVYPCNSLENVDIYAEFLSRNIPVVCIDRPLEGLETPLVTTNNADSMCNIVNRLAETGHRNIGFFSVSSSMAFTETERFRGFCRGIIKNKLPLKKEYIFRTFDLHEKEMTLTTGGQSQLFHRYVKNELLHYLELKEKPTAICCINDSTVNMISKVSRQLGIHIPGDLILTGFDCVDMRKNDEEGFIQVRQDFFHLGATAITLIIQICNGQPYSSINLVDGILLG